MASSQFFEKGKMNVVKVTFIQEAFPFLNAVGEIITKYRANPKDAELNDFFDVDISDFIKEMPNLFWGTIIKLRLNDKNDGTTLLRLMKEYNPELYRQIGIAFLRQMIEMHAHCAQPIFSSESELEEVKTRAIYRNTPYFNQDPEGDDLNSEGYWIDVNKRVFQFVAERQPIFENPMPSTPEDVDKYRATVLETQQFIFSEMTIDDAHRYPIPALPWPGQDHVVVMLENMRNMIEECFRDDQNIKDVIREYCTLLDVPYEDIYKPWRGLGRSGWGSRAIARLPLRQKSGNCEFWFWLAEQETEVRWTEGLKEYIKGYNIIPSAEFLDMLVSMQKHFSKFPIPAMPAIELDPVTRPASGAV